MSSKKMRIVLIAMAAALALAVGGYVLVDHQKKAEEQLIADEEASLKLCSFSTDAITSIDYTNTDGTFHMELQGGNWQLTSTDYPHDFPVNSYYLNSVVAAMSHLTAEQKFERDPALAANYGLDENAATITCHSATAQYTVCVGAPTATKEYYYACLPDAENGSQYAYTIPYTTGATLAGGINYLHDPYLVHVSEVAVNGLKMEHNGETAYDLYTDDAGQWQLRAPLTGVSINTVQVSTIITELVRLQYESFLGFTEDKKELAEYGLDKPAYYLTVSAEGSEDIVFAFPDFDPNDSVIHVYAQNTGTLGTIHARDSMYLTGDWSMLLNSTLLRIPFADAKQLDVTVDGKQFTLGIDHENSRYKLDDIDLSELDSTTNSNFEYLYASVSEISMEEIHPDGDFPEKPEDPACRFVYTLNDGTERTLELVSIDDLTYWAYVDGRCIGQTVRRNSLSGSSGVLSFLEKVTDNLDEQGITYKPADAVPETTPDSTEEQKSADEETAPAESAAEETTQESEDAS